jgi:hypothetical protein
MTAAETHDQYCERLRQAQGDRAAWLQAAVADRPAHVRYLNALMDVPYNALDDVRRPGGVSVRMGAAIVEDVEWTRAPAPEPGQLVAPFPNAYAARRAATAQLSARGRASRIARRAGTAPALRDMLNLGGTS